jgi:hypothetical protein
MRLYVPEAHQWNLTYASGQGGTLSVTSSGEFKDGRGEFFDTEPYNGRTFWFDRSGRTSHQVRAILSKHFRRMGARLGK